jgi:hypothetical protein
MECNPKFLPDESGSMEKFSATGTVRQIDRIFMFGFETTGTGNK